MSKVNNNRRFKLSEVITTIQSDRPPIEVEGDDGTVFTIPPAELWPDEANSLASKGDTEGCSRALLGDQYEKWVEQGGTFGILNEVVARVAGVDTGKSSAS